ncbi:MAG: hypothetical protein IPJ36_07570 [Simplicispira sp.]|nr:hypothetical protein [Simplicispira sp.]
MLRRKLTSQAFDGFVQLLNAVLVVGVLPVSSTLVVDEVLLIMEGTPVY